MKEKLKEQISDALKVLYGINEPNIVITETKKEFDGDFTFAVYPYVKQIGKSPEEIGNEIGNYIKEKLKL